MPKKKDLFLLINSLTKSEKRYFKLKIRMYTKEKDSYSVQMFDAINKRRVQHDNELKNLFKGKMSDMTLERVRRISPTNQDLAYMLGRTDF